MKVTILVENSTIAGKPLLGEHGFSALVETGQARFLFDTGQGKALENNLPALTIPRHPLDGVALSHGHYDHTGGLAVALRWFGPASVYAHPDLFTDHRLIEGREPGSRYIGIPFSRLFLESLGAEFRWINDFSEVAPGIWITGQVPRATSFEVGDPDLVIGCEGAAAPDPLNDDLSLIVESPQGLVILLGCAHAGIINILNHIKNYLPGQPIAAVIGGTHLGLSSPEQLEETIEALRSFRIGKLGVSHCTGLPAAGRLAKEFPDEFCFAVTGTRLIF